MSEGASPMWIQEAAHEIDQNFDTSYSDAESQAHIAKMITKHAPTRQADWEAGRDAAAKANCDMCRGGLTLRKSSEGFWSHPERGTHPEGRTCDSDSIWKLSYPGPSGAQDAPIKNCEHERVDEDGYCRKCGSDTRGGFCLAQDAPQPQNAEEERRNALESLLPGRSANAAQTDWGKGYIEGWVARAKSQPD